MSPSVPPVDLKARIALLEDGVQVLKRSDGAEMIQWLKSHGVEAHQYVELRHQVAAALLIGEEPPAMKPSYLTVELLQRAKVLVRESSLYGRFIDGTPLENDIAVWMAEFAGDIRREHAQAVAAFLNELHAIMVDPCAEGAISVKDMQAALLAAAIRDRDALAASPRVGAEPRE